MRDTAVLQSFLASQREETSQALESRIAHAAIYCQHFHRTNPPIYNFNSPGTLSRSAMSVLYSQNRRWSAYTVAEGGVLEISKILDVLGGY